MRFVFTTARNRRQTCRKRKYPTSTGYSSLPSILTIATRSEIFKRISSGRSKICVRLSSIPNKERKSFDNSWPSSLSKGQKGQTNLIGRRPSARDRATASGNAGTSSGGGKCSGHPVCPLSRRFGPRHRQEDPPILPSVGKESTRSQRKRGVFPRGRKPTVLLIFAIFSAIFKVTKEGALAGNSRKRREISSTEGTRSSISLIACK
jgi:hypothetical protein